MTFSKARNSGEIMGVEYKNKIMQKEGRNINVMLLD